MEPKKSSVHDYLTGVELPASKLEVIAIAEANGAPQATLESLQRVNCERFETLEAVEAAQLAAPGTNDVGPGGHGAR